MRTPIECTRCSTIIGEHTTYPMTFSGQDPDEDEFEDWAVESEDGSMYCSDDCLEADIRERASDEEEYDEDEHEEDFPDENLPEEHRESEYSDPRDSD